MKCLRGTFVPCGLRSEHQAAAIEAQPLTGGVGVGVGLPPFAGGAGCGTGGRGGAGITGADRGGAATGGAGRGVGAGTTGAAGFTGATTGGAGRGVGRAIGAGICGACGFCRTTGSAGWGAGLETGAGFGMEGSGVEILTGGFGRTASGCGIVGCVGFTFVPGSTFAGEPGRFFGRGDSGVGVAVVGGVGG